MKYFDEVKGYVDNYFKKVGGEGHINHLERTVYWVEELEEEADEALKIAAYAHDIQHARRWKNSDGEVIREKSVKRNYLDEEKIKKHEKEGAEMIAEYLKGLGAPEELVTDVKRLVKKHEEGGTHKQDVLKDADSLSFLETKVDDFVDKAGVEVRRKDVRDKFDYMYERISTERAKKTAGPLYKEAVRKLQEG